MKTTLLALASWTFLTLPTIMMPGKEAADAYNRHLFDENSIIINNPWLPLKPGTQFVYEGFTEDEDEKDPHRIVFTVTDLTKMIDGINTIVILEQDFSKNRLIESELAFFAQDKDGNIWYLGEYRETYDELELVGGRAWLAGHLKGAKAGIMMLANPSLGTLSYSEGYAPPPFNWTDRAKVEQVGQKITVPSGSYDDVLVIRETNEEEPRAAQLKYYARGVGNIGVDWIGEDPQKETLKLVKVVMLTLQELKDVRKKVQEHEDRSYVYAQTPKSQPAPQANNKGTNQ